MEQVFQTLEPEFKGKIAFINVNIKEEKQLTNQYKIKIVPTTILVDSSGQVVYRNIGVIKIDEMRSNLNNLN